MNTSISYINRLKLISLLDAFMKIYDNSKEFNSNSIYSIINVKIDFYTWYKHLSANKRAFIKTLISLKDETENAFNEVILGLELDESADYEEEPIDTNSPLNMTLSEIISTYGNSGKIVAVTVNGDAKVAAEEDLDYDDSDINFTDLDNFEEL